MSIRKNNNKSTTTQSITSNLFNGFLFYLPPSSFGNVHLKIMKNNITSNGGAYSQELNENVSHIVFDSVVDVPSEILDFAEMHPKQISIHWKFISDAILMGSLPDYHLRLINLKDFRHKKTAKQEEEFTNQLQKQQQQSKAQQSTKNPFCLHNKLATLRKVQKEGPNKGRLFYSCSKRNSCNFFEWATDQTIQLIEQHQQQHQNDDDANAQKIENKPKIIEKKEKESIKISEPDKWRKLFEEQSVQKISSLSQPQMKEFGNNKSNNIFPTNNFQQRERDTSILSLQEEDFFEAPNLLFFDENQPTSETKQENNDDEKHLQQNDISMFDKDSPPRDYDIQYVEDGTIDFVPHQFEISSTLQSNEMNTGKSTINNANLLFDDSQIISNVTSSKKRNFIGDSDKFSLKKQKITTNDSRLNDSRLNDSRLNDSTLNDSMITQTLQISSSPPITSSLSSNFGSSTIKTYQRLKGNASKPILKSLKSRNIQTTTTTITKTESISNITTTTTSTISTRTSNLLSESKFVKPLSPKKLKINNSSPVEISSLANKLYSPQLSESSVDDSKSDTQPLSDQNLTKQPSNIIPTKVESLVKPLKDGEELDLAKLGLNVESFENEKEKEKIPTESESDEEWRAKKSFKSTNTATTTTSTTTSKTISSNDSKSPYGGKSFHNAATVANQKRQRWKKGFYFPGLRQVSSKSDGMESPLPSDSPLRSNGEEDEEDVLAQLKEGTLSKHLLSNSPENEKLEQMISGKVKPLQLAPQFADSRKRNAFACQKGLMPQKQQTNLNKEITDILEILEKKNEARREQWRQTAYRKACNAIKRYPKKIESVEEAKTINGVGDRIAKKIGEILETGSLRQATIQSEKDNLLALFSNVWGAGSRTTERWIAKGYTTLEDLTEKESDQLTYQQRIGVRHYHDFLKRIPRDEVTECEDVVKNFLKKFNPDLLAVTCGSYRRGKPNCGDIDMLITNTNPHGNTEGVLLSVVTKLHEIGFLTDDLNVKWSDPKEKTYMGVCRLPGKPYRRIDLRVYPLHEWPCALLYFTGSGHFNRSIRYFAHRNGYSLSDKSLVKRFSEEEKGDPIPLRSEADIFKLLRLKYVPPEGRDI